MEKRLYRRPDEGQISGVAAGFAEYFQLDPTVMRVIFIGAVFITSGLAIFIYLLLALVLPIEGETSSGFNERMNQLTEGVSSERTRNWLGIGLIVLGGWYLVSYLWPGWLNISWRVLWSLALVFIGVALLTKGRR